MRKKVIVVIVAIVVICVAVKLCNRHDDTPVWENNEVIATFNGISVDEKGEKPMTSKLVIDASGSMKPYFYTDDKRLINTLSEIKNLNAIDKEIYFLGNPKPYTGLIKNILGDVRKQPNLTETSFHEFFKTAANEIDTVSTIIYFVTDGIMSLGNNGDTEKALVEFRGRIESSLKGHADLAGAILRYEGGFKGDYWDKQNRKHTLKNEIQRPYYIIALGKRNAIRWLAEQNNKSLNSPENKLFFNIHDYKSHMSARMNGNKGDFAKLEDIGKNVKLILNDLPSCLQNINTDHASLRYSDGELLKGDTIIIENNSITSLINSAITSDVDTVKIRLSVPNELPQDWLTTWNCDDDSQGPDEVSTFSLGTLVQGMFNALEQEHEELLGIDFTFKMQ
ncbi:MAG: hypothetical protein LUC91_05775 [Prevotella sp.]|nr:hypothetical protein [Prevotella sp.]